MYYQRLCYEFIHLNLWVSCFRGAHFYSSIPKISPPPIPAYILHLRMILQAKAITRNFGSLQVLKGINLDIAPQEIVSITGPSGAGKTTLLQILGTLDSPNGGELSIDGKLVNNLNSKALAAFRNTKLGFIFQFHHLLPEFTALENVSLPGLLAGKSTNSVKAKATELLERLGLGHRLNHRPTEMSGGEQQRAAVARALVNEPAIVFADEPSGNLDSTNADDLHQLFFQLRDEFKQTFVIVTHNEILAEMADRRIRLRDGLIEA